MFLSALEAMDARCREKHLELEKRIERLESDRKPAS
jgi:BMFP domain-containing protein YqiC